MRSNLFQIGRFFFCLHEQWPILPLVKEKFKFSLQPSAEKRRSWKEFNDCKREKKNDDSRWINEGFLNEGSPNFFYDSHISSPRRRDWWEQPLQYQGGNITFPMSESNVKVMGTDGKLSSKPVFSRVSPSLRSIRRRRHSHRYVCTS